MSSTPWSADALLAQAAWVRHLAGTMVGDEASALDLAQDTMVTAMRRGRDVRDPRGWLRRVMQNLVRQGARARQRRVARERAVARGEVSSDGPGAAVERAELHRALVDRVLELPEPGRTTVLERFFEELEPRAIARRHGVPLETVRTRLRRALQRLRETMDGDDRAGDGRWRALALPLAAPAGAAVATAGGVVVMSTGSKWMFAGAAGLVLGLGAFAWSAVDGAEATPAAPVPPPPLTLTAAAEAPPSPAARAPVVAGTPLLARLTGLSTQVPWSTALRVELVAGARRVELGIRPDATGLVEVYLPQWAPPDAVAVEIVADDPGYLRATWRRPPGPLSEPWPLPVSCAAVVAGSVRGGADATVRAYPMLGDVPAQDSIAATTCDADGGFRLRLRGGDYLLVAGDLPGFLPVGQRVSARVASVADAGELEPVAPVEITGRLTFAGRPLAATLHANAVGVDRQLAWDLGTLLCWWRDAAVLAPFERTVRPGDDGGFAFPGLAPVRYAVRLREVPMAIPVFPLPLQVVTAPAHLDLSLSGVWVHVHLRAPVALEQARLRVEVPKTNYELPVVSGAAQLILPLGVEARLRASAVGRQPVERLLLTTEPGEIDVTIDLTEPVARRLVVTAPAEVAGEEVMLTCEPEGGGENWQRWITLADGELVLEDVPAGRFRALVTPSGGSYLRTLHADLSVPERGDGRLHLDLERGGRIRLAAAAGGDLLGGSWRLLDARGEQLAVTLMASIDNAAVHYLGGRVPPRREARTVESLPPGRYRAEVALDGRPVRTYVVDVVAGRTVTLELP